MLETSCAFILQYPTGHSDKEVSFDLAPYLCNLKMIRLQVSQKKAIFNTTVLEFVLREPVLCSFQDFIGIKIPFSHH